MEREIGYYWVLHENSQNWEVAKWDGNYWFRVYSYSEWFDNDFKKIGNRIVNDNKE